VAWTDEARKKSIEVRRLKALMHKRLQLKRKRESTFEIGPIGRAFSEASTMSGREWRDKYKQQYQDDLEFQAVCDGVFAFTGSDWKRFRRTAQAMVTGKFLLSQKDDDYGENAALAVMQDKVYGAWGFFNVVRPPEKLTREYCARAMLNALAESPPLNRPLYRGRPVTVERDVPRDEGVMRMLPGRLGVAQELTAEPRDPRAEMRRSGELQAMLHPYVPKVGEVFDMPGMASFTEDSDKAREFVFNNFYKPGREKPKRVMVYEVEPGAKGLVGSMLSGYPEEQEVITGGKFKVMGVETRKRRVPKEDWKAAGYQLINAPLSANGQDVEWEEVVVKLRQVGVYKPKYSSLKVKEVRMPWQLQERKERQQARKSRS
jgi:hypothetical protein